MIIKAVLYGLITMTVSGIFSIIVSEVIGIKPDFGYALACYAILEIYWLKEWVKKNFVRNY